MAKRSKEIKKKRLKWHSSYDPAIVLFILIVAVAFGFNLMSGAGIVMLASITSSAFILMHRHRRHLTKLGTISSAYIVGAVLSAVLVLLLSYGGTDPRVQLFAVLFIITVVLYWLNLFHPPAISFAMAFTIFQRTATEYFFILFASIIIFIIVRLAAYIVYEHLTIGDFLKEVVIEEEHLLIREEKRIKKALKKI